MVWLSIQCDYLYNLYATVKKNFEFRFQNFSENTNLFKICHWDVTEEVWRTSPCITNVMILKIWLWRHWNWENTSWDVLCLMVRWYAWESRPLERDFRYVSTSSSFFIKIFLLFFFKIDISTMSPNRVVCTIVWVLTDLVLLALNPSSLSVDLRGPSYIVV